MYSGYLVVLSRRVILQVVPNVTDNRTSRCSTLKIKVVCSKALTTIDKSTRCHNPHLHHRGNLKSRPSLRSRVICISYRFKISSGTKNSFDDR
jgi:hypothetical protein